MASFTLVRELLELPRDNGSRRLMVGLYSASDDPATDSGKRYLACSEQEKSADGQWISRRRGITIRRGEAQAVIAALQSADFNAGPDTKGLSDREYAELYCDW